LSSAVKSSPAALTVFPIGVVPASRFPSRTRSPCPSGSIRWIAPSPSGVEKKSTPMPVCQTGPSVDCPASKIGCTPSTPSIGFVFCSSIVAPGCGPSADPGSLGVSPRCTPGFEPSFELLLHPIA
jgi:hypothetical protein